MFDFLNDFFESKFTEYGTLVVIIVLAFVFASGIFFAAMYYRKIKYAIMIRDSNLMKKEIESLKTTCERLHNEIDQLMEWKNRNEISCAIYAAENKPALDPALKQFLKD
jgi:hypothetical protein